MVQKYLSLSLFAVLLSSSLVAMETALPGSGRIESEIAAEESTLKKAELVVVETKEVVAPVAAPVVEEPVVAQTEPAAPAVATVVTEVKEVVTTANDVVAPKAQGKIAAAVSSVKASASTAKSWVANTTKKATNGVTSGLTTAKNSVVNGSSRVVTGTKANATALVEYTKAHPFKALLVATGVTGTVAGVVALVAMLQNKTENNVARASEVEAEFGYEQLADILIAFEVLMTESDDARTVPCALRSVDTSAMSEQLQELYAQLATAYEQGATKEEITAGLQVLLLATLSEMGIDPEQFAQQLASIVEQAQAQA